MDYNSIIKQIKNKPDEIKIMIYNSCLSNIINTEIKNFKFTDCKNLEELVINTLVKEKNINFPPSLTKLIFDGYRNKFNLNNLNNLIILDCSNSSTFSLNLEELKNLEYLNCKNNKLEILKNLPKTLKKLICSHNKISLIEDLPDELQILDISYNNISKLINLPIKLKYLNCSSNEQLNNLNFLPNSLEILHMNDLKISSNILIGNDLPNSLIQLSCVKCNLVKIESLPINLRLLNCSNNCIELLNNFSEKLVHLNCKNNKISKLENLPLGLKFLNCTNNYISTIDNLPDSLDTLYCSYNEIIDITFLPSNIQKYVYKPQRHEFLREVLNPMFISQINCWMYDL